jgi:curved DNA-binding protein CbpA
MVELTMALLPRSFFKSSLASFLAFFSLWRTSLSIFYRKAENSLFLTILEERRYGRRKKIKGEATMEQPAIRQTREKCKHKTCRIWTHTKTNERERKKFAIVWNLKINNKECASAKKVVGEVELKSEQQCLRQANTRSLTLTHIIRYECVKGAQEGKNEIEFQWIFFAITDFDEIYCVGRALPTFSFCVFKVIFYVTHFRRRR